MVNTCVIFGCHNRADKGQVKRSYHTIPKVIVNQGEQTKTLSTKRREEWIARIGRKDWTPSQYSKVCSDHFVTGKDRIIFATKEDQEKPSTAIIIESKDEEPGLTLPNGDINWHCPCHGSDIFGPCAVEYREARTCFHNSKADPRGSDCHDSMMPWIRCLAEQSGVDLLGKEDDEEEEEEGEDNGFHEALEIDRKRYESSNENSSDKNEKERPGANKVNSS